MKAKVTIRDLRNRGGQVVDGVRRSGPVTVTRAGEPVAELHAVSPQPMTAATLLERWAKLPPVDPDALRADIDELLDPSL